MIPDNFSTLAEQVGPAVVNIQVEKTTKGEDDVVDQARVGVGQPARNSSAGVHFLLERETDEGLT